MINMLLRFKNIIILIITIIVLILLVVFALSKQNETPVEKYMKHNFKHVSYKTMKLIDITEYKDYRLELYVFNGNDTDIAAFLLKKDSKNDFNVVENSSLVHNFESYRVFFHVDDVSNDLISCIITDGKPRSVGISVLDKSKKFDLSKGKLGGYIFDIVDIFDLEKSVGNEVTYTFFDENKHKVNSTD